jgi:dihydrofolate synthase / folylpolyglutamate synthase
VGLDGPRALPAAELAARLKPVVDGPVAEAASVVTGCGLAQAQARPGDRIVVFGSFHTVGAALQWLAMPA